jgi:hypothetical protein
MDATHFDTITRSFSRSSRRQTFSLIRGLGFAVMLGQRGTEAKRKKKKKHK